MAEEIKMNKIYELVTLAKHKQDIESDNAFAVRNGFTRAHINNWKSGISSPSALNFMKLCKAAGFETITEALDFIEESEKQRKQAGFATLPMMGAIGVMSLIIVSPTPAGFIGAAFGALIVANIHYAKLKNSGFHGFFSVSSDHNSTINMPPLQACFSLWF